MQYTSDQFTVNQAWLVFRINSLIQVEDKLVDIYMLMDIGSAYIFGQILVTDDLPTRFEINRLMKDACDMKKQWPEILYCATNDPAEGLFSEYAAGKKVSFKVEPAASFSRLIEPVRQSLREFQQRDNFNEGPLSDEDEEAFQTFIPDTYDPCPCGSGSKFKFCCKPVFTEIVHAMALAEEGKTRDALKWMEKAKKKAGETPEILCRYAIVYSYYDKAKSEEYLEQCLNAFPDHPRANYIKGIDLKNKGDYEGSVAAYTRAVNSYPPNDRFHLNETWNNMGSAYFEMKKYAEAKEAWQKALEYLPRDRMTRNNLKYMIYENPNVPDDIKNGPSLHLLDPEDVTH